MKTRNIPSYLILCNLIAADSQSQEYKGRVRAVLGYHLEVNGRLYARIAPTERTFVLRKCRPGTKYSCVLTILTSPEGFDGKRFVEVRKPRKRLCELVYSGKF